jgi:hypothetical protein
MLVAVLLIFIANRIHEKTEAAKKFAEEKVKAEKHLAELRKRTVPPPVVWIPLAGALLCIISAIALLYFFDLPPGPPFGW